VSAAGKCQRRTAGIGVVGAGETAIVGVMKLLFLIRWAGLFAVLGAVAAAAAEKYKVGDTFAAFSTKDQHDKPFTYEPGARLVIVSFEMGTGKAANTFFETKGAAFLGEQKAVFIANIYGMPGIARAFALPKMRKYPHRILLGDGADFLARYPEKEDFLTVLTLDPKGTITDIRHVNPKKEMATIFAAPAGK
jgi:hypothetical protein